VTKTSARVSQPQKPTGWLGRVVLRSMNSRHSKVTDWGLSQISIQEHDTILDVGCGGGRTISKLAALATRGKVYGVDFSQESVAVSGKTNKQWIEKGRVEIHEGSVSQLPFPADMFDLVTAVETHFWWPDLPADMREVFRVVKPGGTFVVIAEVYKGANTATAKLVEKYLPQMGLKFLTASEHHDLFTQACYTDVRVITESSKGWICVIGKKPVG